MLHFTKNANLHKYICLFAMVSLPLMFCSCGHSTQKKNQNQGTEEQNQPSKQQYRIKVVHTPIEIVNYEEEHGFRMMGDLGRVNTKISFYLTDTNGEPLVLNPEGDYEDIAIPCKCAIVFGIGDRYKNELKDMATKLTSAQKYDRTTFSTSKDALNVVNKHIELLEKYINYVWELPLTNQPIDSEIKEMLNRIYYNLDLMNYSIVETSRSYDIISYGLLNNDKVFYNPNDLSGISFCRDNNGIKISDTYLDIFCSYRN